MNPKISLTKPATRKQQVEAIVDFKARIAMIMREREGRGKFSVIGASHADPCVVRKGKK